MNIKTALYLGYSGPPTIWLISLVISQKTTPYYTILTTLIVLHYLKRLLESKFVHIHADRKKIKFSEFFGLFFFYSILGGVGICSEIYYRNLNLFDFWFSDFFVFFFIFLFFVFEILNFFCHFKLRKLRIEIENGKQIITNKRKIPKGLFFDHIISPNYTFEIFSWVCFCFLSRSFVCIFFTAMGGLTMYNWGVEKKNSLLKNNCFSEFEKESVRKRGILIPKF